MKSFWDQFEGEITEVYTCTSCKSTIERLESFNYLLLNFPGDKVKKKYTVQSLIEFYLGETDVEDYNCSGRCQKKTSATSKSSISKFPSFMCIVLCRNGGDSNGIITSAVEYPALGFDIKGDQMPYDLSATVHHKETKGGKGHYTAISRSRNLQSQQWFMYDDERVSLVNFTKTHKNQTVVRMTFTKTPTILFYVNPSIETRIRKSKTIDLMEGGKEAAQNVPYSEINPCDGEGCAKNDKKDDDEEEKRESGEVESSGGEESSSMDVVPPRPRPPRNRRNRNVFSSTDSSTYSSDSSDSSS